ncbi:GNAT family N-acetyltransferase [Longispora sp. K20-0274]|uniref:GNAT family N-acetyltransferase n=1 Tax=Longispora sp. K20-0274 TaxID=3088255 RepID=UPI00399B9CE8
MLIIRDATPEDLPATVDLHVRTWRAAYRGLVPDSYLDAIDTAEWLAAQRAVAGNPGRHRIVALLDDVIVGFASFGDDRSDPALAEVYAIYVDPDRQGHGVGRALMDEAVSRLAGRETRLWCAEGNAATRLFYERYGLVTDGATRVYDRDGLTLPTVRYRLTR